jgi:hypothetical protein
MRTTSLAVACVIAMAVPSSAAVGQAPLDSSAVARVSSTLGGTNTLSRPAREKDDYGDDFAKRFALGVVGFVGGASVGHRIGTQIHSCSGCWFGSTQTITGMLSGALLGTSLLAIPSLRSACKAPTRIRRAAAGAGIGYVIGVLLTAPYFLTPHPLAGPGVALYTALGATVLQGHCL